MARPPRASGCISGPRASWRTGDHGRCRVLAARTLTQNAALLILDQKGDEEDVQQMSRLAAAAEVPFVLIDPQDPCSDRYQPLWGTPAQVAARAVEPIKQSEPYYYYYDVLRLHLDTVCRILHTADRWLPSIPFLIDACHPLHYEALGEIAQGLGDRHRPLIHRVAEHGRYVSSRKGKEDLAGGAAGLQVALALARPRDRDPEDHVRQRRCRRRAGQRA